MGVLDTFVFLLETDNRNALKGLNDTDQAIDDVQDGSKDAHKALLNMFTGVGEKAGVTTASLKELAVAAIGIAGAGLSLNAVLEHTTEMLGKVQAAETVGVDVGQYDALSRTFQTLGVDADGFRDSMIDLNEAMGEAASDAKSGKAESFKTFGISLRDAQGNIKSADEALLELSDTMSKMDKQQATFQIKQLGITDNAVIAAMMNGRKELERRIDLQKTLGVLNEKDVAQLKSFKSAQDELSTIFSRFADVLAITVAPSLELIIDVTKSLIEWGTKHKTFIVSFLGVLAGVAIPALTASLWSMATAAWAAIAPFVPFIAAAVALALVIDDLWNYFNGGESVIGDLVKQFPILGEALNAAKESVIEMWDALQLLFSDPAKFLDALVAEFKASWETIANDTMSILTALWDWITGLFGKLGSFISDSVSNAASGAMNSVKGWLGIGGDSQSTGGNPLSDSSSYASAANNALAGAAAAPVIPSNPAAISKGGPSSVTATQKIDTINIQTGSGDPQQIRTAVSDGMNDSVQQLTNQYDDGRSH